MKNEINYTAVINFWFSEIASSSWYKKDSAFDQEITKRFLGVYEQAIRGELFSWRKSIEGRLAEILVLDQFSRNMFRNNPKAFQYDCLALILSQEASILKQAKELEPQRRSFLYMPFMHSESLIVHEQAVILFGEAGLENNLKFEFKHKKIIERFGRYPHRNEVLGRESTSEEVEFLKQPGSSF